VLTIELTGEEGKITKFLGLMDAFGIKDLSRTGKIALVRAEGLSRPIFQS
jgi:acetolactate synthase I/III small subunit